MRTAIATLAILLISATAAQANLNAVNESTDEAGNVWHLYSGSLAGGEVREEGGAGVHFSVSMLDKGIAVGGGHVYLSSVFGVSELTMTGTMIRSFDEGGLWLNGVAVDPNTHNVFVGERAHVSVFSGEGLPMGGFGSEQVLCTESACWEELTAATGGIEVDKAGTVSVKDLQGVGKWAWEQVQRP